LNYRSACDKAAGANGNVTGKKSHKQAELRQIIKPIYRTITRE